MSFALTARQFCDGSKTVTRRMGWASLKPGTRLMGVLKSQGLKKGEKVKRLGALEVVSVRQEQLLRIQDEGREGCASEGFPLLTPLEFVNMFCEHANWKVGPDSVVTRVEFVRVPSGIRCEAQQPKGLSPDGCTYPGGQCGLDLGHDGDHTLLMETSAPWFGEGT